MMDDATRARTIVAAGNWLQWSVGAEEIWAPYFEDSGTPVLLVERHVRDYLLDLGSAETTSSVLPGLGEMRLGGQLWPVAGSRYLEGLRQFRDQHEDCPDCCGSRRTHLVGVRIERIELTSADQGTVTPVDLDEYLAAAPDPVVAHTARVSAHLNAEHHDDLLTLASHLLAEPRDQLLAANVAWIDASGLDLTVIDRSGSRSSRFAFRTPLTVMDDLGGQLHGLLAQASADPC